MSGSLQPYALAPATPCLQVRECDKLRDFGAKNRHTGATAMNQDSSRSLTPPLTLGLALALTLPLTPTLTLALTLTGLLPLALDLYDHHGEL